MFYKNRFWCDKKMKRGIFTIVIVMLFIITSISFIASGDSKDSTDLTIDFGQKELTSFTGIAFFCHNILQLKLFYS